MLGIWHLAFNAEVEAVFWTVFGGYDSFIFYDSPQNGFFHESIAYLSNLENFTANPLFVLLIMVVEPADHSCLVRIVVKIFSCEKTSLLETEVGLVFLITLSHKFLVWGL